MPSLSSQGLETAEIYCNIEVYDVKMLTDSNKMALLLHQVGNLIHELSLVGCKCLNPQRQSTGFKFAQGKKYCLAYSSLLTVPFRVISYLKRASNQLLLEKVCCNGSPA